MNRGNDTGISSAAADVSAHVLHNLFIRGGRVGAEQSMGGHDHSRSAIAALKSFFVKKRLLHGMQVAILREGFNGLDFFTGRRGRRSSARADRTAIEQYGASATLAFPAPVLVPGHSHPVPPAPN